VGRAACAAAAAFAAVTAAGAGEEPPDSNPPPGPGSAAVSANRSNSCEGAATTPCTYGEPNHTRTLKTCISCVHTEHDLYFLTMMAVAAMEAWTIKVPGPRASTTVCAQIRRMDVAHRERSNKCCVVKKM
jgi:hypothetical protein